MRNRISTSMLCVLLSLPAAALAQAPAPKPPEGDKPEVKPRPKAAEPAAGQPETAALAEKLKQQQKQLDEQAKRLKKLDVVEKKLDEMEKERDEEKLKKLKESGGKSFKPSFRIFGFTDFSLSRFFPKKGDFMEVATSKDLTFTAVSANLYFASQITRKLSTLLELRFTYLPQGVIEEYNSYTRMNGQLTPVEDVQFTRKDQTVSSPVDATYFRLGGLVIERIHADYKVADWLQIRVGRFLTPFSVWNTDHGSPTVIPVCVPYQHRTWFVPLAQTGIYVFGRVFPRDDLYIDYGLTVSNGRGPADSVMDVDDHKALGVRAKIAYDTPKIKVELGTYGYWGRIKDKEKGYYYDLGTAEMGSVLVTTEHADELIATVDLRVEAYGLLLQSEFAYRRVNYLSPSSGTTMQRSFGSGFLTEGAIYADFAEWAYFALLGYTLPLKGWLGKMKITPYVMHNLVAGDNDSRFHIPVVGINFKPFPALVFKAEWEHVRSYLNKELWAKNHLVRIQMAVAF